MNRSLLTIVHGLLSSCDFVVKLVITTLQRQVSLLRFGLLKIELT